MHIFIILVLVCLGAWKLPRATTSVLGGITIIAALAVIFDSSPLSLFYSTGDKIICLIVVVATVLAIRNSYITCSGFISCPSIAALLLCTSRGLPEILLLILLTVGIGGVVFSTVKDYTARPKSTYTYNPPLTSNDVLPGCDQCIDNNRYDSFTCKYCGRSNKGSSY